MVKNRPSLVKLLATMALTGILLTLSQQSWTLDRDSYYSVRVRTFSTFDAASQFVSMMKESGYHAFHRFCSVPGKNGCHEAYVGKFYDKSAAKKKLIELVEADVSDQVSIVKLPIGTMGNIHSEPMYHNFGDSNDSSIKKKSYRLHIDSYLEMDDAKSEMARLQQFGLKTFLETHEKENLTWFRIYIGGYDTFSEAAETGERLVRDQLILAYNVDTYFISNNSVPSAIQTNKVKGEVQAKTSIPTTHNEPRQDGANDSNLFEGRQDEAELTEDSRFSVGVRTGYYKAINLDKFKITSDGENEEEIWRFDGNSANNISLPFSYRLNDYLDLEARPEWIGTDAYDARFITLGTKLTSKLSEHVFPYLSTGLVYGTFDWEDAPGDFDPAWGWEAGLGVYYKTPKIRFGADYSIRGISFDYNSPEIGSIYSNSEDLDFTGYNFSISIDYQF